MSRALAVAAAALLAAVPFLRVPEYFMHLIVLILIWSLAYTAWSLMGRFGLVSLGHGAFMGIGAYTVAMLWNTLQLTPWIGIPIALALAALTSVVIGVTSPRRAPRCSVRSGLSNRAPTIQGEGCPLAASTSRSMLPESSSSPRRIANGRSR